MTFTITWHSFLHWAWLIGEPVVCLVIGFIVGALFVVNAEMSATRKYFGW